MYFTYRYFIMIYYTFAQLLIQFSAVWRYAYKLAANCNRRFAYIHPDVTPAESLREQLRQSAGLLLFQLKLLDQNLS
jgi:hypothetical protein